MSALVIDHPRPRLRRDRWTSLDGEWAFVRDPDDHGLRNNWQAGQWQHDQQTITVPFAPEWSASGITEHEPSSVVWYQRTIRRPADAHPDEGLLLHFGAVDHSCQVWIDGEQVAHHVGGYTPFEADVSRLLANDDEHQLVVRVVDDNQAMHQPRGKQHWYGINDAIWYTPTTGIWQSVWLEPVVRVHLVDLITTPDIAAGTVACQVQVAGLTPADSTRVEVTATFEDHPIAWGAASVDRQGWASLSLSLAGQHPGVRGDDYIDAGGVRLWTPQQPNLYDLQVRVISGEASSDGDRATTDDAPVIDEVRSHVGMREIDVIDSRLCLNKRPVVQKLVLDQGYWPKTGLTPPSDQAIIDDIELAKAMGFNGARKHQKIEDPRFLYAADRLGFLVWDELPSAYAFTPAAVAELTTTLTEQIKRDRSHACVVAWVPINESWGTPDLTDARQQALQRCLYWLATSLDGTRPVIGNDGWEMVISDLIAVHDYRTPSELASGYDGELKAVKPPAGRRLLIGDGVDASATPRLVTEFGGLSLSDDEGWGYHSVNSGEELVAEIGARIEAIASNPDWQGYCYTQLTDVGTEVNGLLTFDRQPKLDVAALKAVQDSLPG